MPAGNNSLFSPNDKIRHWLRRNPLKLTGIIWITGEILTALAGGFNLHNPVLVVAAVCGAISCSIVIIWGRGGEEDAPHEVAPARVLRIREMFSFRKCLLGWRYPVESAAFWGFVNGVAYATSGFQQWLDSGHIGWTESTMIGGGALFVIGSIYANCVPDRPGHWSPMVKSALYYIVGDLVFEVAAFREKSLLLGVSMLVFIASNIPWAISRRYENKG